MAIKFYKYQGTGNDFIIIDEHNFKLEKSFPDHQKTIKNLCDRKFGIGADGLILLQKSKSHNFKMKYYNSDGKEGTMCGNGGRCIAAFAHHKGYAPETMTFEAIDGIHEAQVISSKQFVEAEVKIKLNDVTGYQKINNTFFIDTGSPHYVKFVDNLKTYDVIKNGRKIRNSDKYKPDGTNVNFVELSSRKIFVRTFERGVENETLSCGTGVAASAIALFLKGIRKKSYKVYTAGGSLSVTFNTDNESGSIENLWLQGPANYVFSGEIAIF